MSGSEKLLLTTASSISVDEVTALVRKYGGTAFPAHINRPSYSVTASLGTVPQVGFEAVEVTADGDVESLSAMYSEMRGKPVLYNSDAHFLGQIQDAGPWLDLTDCSAQSLISALNGKSKFLWGK
ncbi:hypothetical protein SDC9_195638 [bioreactor metagenome]|uniref:PHP domain-containing protein n=1 Tax=bioreactor metagenome TaxID=1076179 RepID=A0A645II98_9ZZZZ